jgi:hypothetical protein
MLKQRDKDVEVTGETLGVAVDLMAEQARVVAEKLSNIAQGSIDEYVPLSERLSELAAQGGAGG